MKPTKLLSLAALAMLVLSCAKEAQNDSDLLVNGFTQVSASYDGFDSKTSLASDGTTVLWSPNDSISVFCNGNGQKFTAINSKSKAWTVFQSDKGLQYGGSGAGQSYIWGIYPYSKDNSQDDQVVTLTVPAEQVAAEGSFGEGSFAAVGRSTSTNIVFYNVCGGIRFTLSQTGIRKIKLYGNNDEYLAGKVKVAFSAQNIPLVADVVSGSKCITLSAPNNGEFQTGKWYYISTIPVSLTSGFTVEFIKRVNESERGYKSYSSSRDIKRSVFGSVDQMDKNVTYEIVITEVKMSQTQLTIKPSATAQLSYSLVPEDAPAKSAVWSSSNDQVATVDQNGLVTAKALGTAVISATVGKCVGTTDVLVANDNITSITLAPKNNYIYEGGNVQLSKTTVPATSSEVVQWISGDEKIATVSQSGLVTGIAVGSTTITCKAAACSTSVNVTVLSNKVTSIVLSPNAYQMSVGGNVKIGAQTFPAGVTETVVWSSADNSIATVDQTGLVTAVSNGSTTIYAKTSKAEASASIVVFSGIYLTQVDALTKILNTKTYSDNRDVIRVARGETATIQMAVEAPTGASNLSAEITGLTMTGVTPKLYWEREILCSRHWDEWAGGAPTDEIYANGNKYYDALMPVADWNPGTIASGGRAAVWCEIAVPRTMAPGTYTGKVKVSGTYSGGTAMCEKPFTIQVYNVTLPEKLTLNVDNWTQGGFWQVNNGKDETVEEWFEIQGKLVEFMNDFHQTTYKAEQALRSTYNPTVSGGKIVYDFSMIKREIELYASKCSNFKYMRGQDLAVREQDYPWLLAFNIPYISGGTAKWKYVNNEDSDAEVLLKAFITELYTYLCNNKLPDGRRYVDAYIFGIIDEPKDDLASSYSTVAKWVKEAAPDMKIGNAIETANITPAYLDFPCPTEAAIETNRAKGNQVQWMYICEQPQANYANRFIRIPLIKSRLVHWCNFYYNAPHYLHWALKSWNDDPYNYDAYDRFVGGDEFIIYPGGYRKFNPSIRLCAMRDGIYDFELMTMLKAKNAAKASTILGKVVKGPASYETDVTNFRTYRMEILEELSK